MIYAYSNDLRLKVVEAAKSGTPKETIAKMFNIGIASIYRWMRMEALTGSVNAKEDFHKGHSHKITDLDAFKKFVAENNTLTSKQMAVKWTDKTGVKLTAKTILLYLHNIFLIRHYAPATKAKVP